MIGFQDIEVDLGEAVRQIRIKKGLSLDEVAARANLSPTAVRSLELGRGSTLRTFIKVLAILDETKLLTDWAHRSEEFSPIAIFRDSQKKNAKPQRVSRRHSD